MQDETEILNSLVEEHKSDFEPAQENSNDEGDNSGGDNSQDNSQDEADGADNSSKDAEIQSDGDKSTKPEDESGKDKGEPTESDDSKNAKAELVGEKKDANYRIRQLNERTKELEKKLAEKEIAEAKERESKEDPVYKLEDFLGTYDKDGEPLTDKEAEAKFQAWEADYKLRQFQKGQVLKEQQDTLISLQRETADAFTKFPEFNMTSDKYDQELAEIANEAFRAGLIYKDGHDGDDNYIIGSRVNPGQLLEKLHNLRAKVTSTVTKVNNLPSEDSKIISSQQVNKSAPKYEPGFRGEVDKELDKLIKKEF